MFRQRKPKRCPCACHWRATGQLNPPDVHCSQCPEAMAKLLQRRRENASMSGQRRRIEKQLDDLISLNVRLRANWRCVKCKKKYTPVMSKVTRLPAQNLMTASHYFNRGKYGTRWDYENIDALCIFCHTEIEHYKNEWVGVEQFNYEYFMLAKLGEKRFRALAYKAEAIRNFAVFELSSMLTAAQKELDALLVEKGYKIAT